MVGIDRFRGNLVISGGAPFAEDTWGKIRLGTQVFQCMGRCTRCQMICVDQSSGMRSQEPLKTLATFRRFEVWMELYAYSLTLFSELWDLNLGHCRARPCLDNI